VRAAATFVDDTLQMACAVEDGMVLRLTRAGDLLGTTREALTTARAEVGEAAGLIAFNCLGRYRAAEAARLIGPLGRLYAEHRAVGFNTYGEQFNSMHLNYTLTGLYLGAGASA
jgi:hypothetical protein